MRKTKQIGMLASCIFLGNVLFAQSIDDGKKFLNYERYTSAYNVFSKLVAANPNDVDAVYWLGQTYLQNTDNTDTGAALALYQKTLQANPNSPLIMTGVGEVELMQGKKADANKMFEAAIGASNKKNAADVLTAVGRANVNEKNGDPTYAITKLQQAADKDKKNAAIQVLLGDAYRKLVDGANATLAYNAALQIDPKDARADFMIGRIYETQGYGQEAVYMKYYNDAIAADPNFAPVYYWLYNYYYQRDVNKSSDYLNKYIAVADPSSKNCYAQASLSYVSKLYQQAISKADECISSAGANAFPNLYGLKAYSYDKMGDSVNAKKYFDQFFAKINPDKIGPNDYATYAKVLLKFPGNDSLAATYVDKAVALDSVPANKIGYIKTIAESLVAAQKYDQAGAWYAKILALKPDYTNIDLYYAGYNDYRGGNYKSADSVFQLYQTKYPNDIFGWYMDARSKEGIDSTGANGLALPDYQKVILIADSSISKDSSNKDKVKANEITAYRYMVAYYYNIKKDVPSAIQYNDKILALDPTDQLANTNKGVFARLRAKSK